MAVAGPEPGGLGREDTPDNADGLTHGDLLFFYHAKNTRRKIDRLLEEAHEIFEEISSVLESRARREGTERDEAALSSRGEHRVLEGACHIDTMTDPATAREVVASTATTSSFVPRLAAASYQRSGGPSAASGVSAC